MHVGSHNIWFTYASNHPLSVLDSGFVSIRPEYIIWFNSHLLWNAAPVSISCVQKTNEFTCPGETSTSSTYYMKTINRFIRHTTSRHDKTL